MRQCGFISLVSVGILFSSIVGAFLNPLVVKGNAFFDSVTNDRFYIRGVDYQVPTCIHLFTDVY
jgi:Glucanosyltransferase